MIQNRISMQILSLFPELIPGIEQVVLVHSEQDNDGLTGYLLRKSDQGYNTDQIRVESGSTFFLSLQENSLPYQWFSKDRIPFEIISKEKVQLTIFSELKNSVLMILYHYPESTLTDLFFIYFNENLSNFLIDKVSEPLSAQHKNMVGYLLSNSIKTLYQVFSSTKQLTTTFNDQIQAIVGDRDRLKEKIDRIYGKERQDVLKMAQHYLNKVSGELGISASLTDSAKVRLRDFTGELYQLEDMMREAIDFAGALSSASAPRQVLLADYHIRFPEKSQEKIPAEVMEGLPQRYIKTHLLLDRLELAATGLKERRSSLTSVNVGKEFPTPISAPAITDALRKHKKRIIHLFDQYPEKWEIIRHEFRPIQNILNTIQDFEQLSA